MAEPIPGYRIQERIGAGGYGEVWKADAPGGIAKAIKVVYGYHDDERATRELNALNRIKQVRHPFLLSLERIEVVDGHLVIVTELATSSLKNLFEQYRQSGLPGIPREELLDAAGRRRRRPGLHLRRSIPSSTWTSSPKTCCWWAGGRKWRTSAW